jgi:hypothetical protein
MFCLQVSSEYTDMKTYKISFNSILHNMFIFPSISDTAQAGYNQILINNFNPQGSNYNIYQQTSSISKFYDLVRIVLVSNFIPVNGDIEGLGYTNIKVLTDCVPDTSSLSVSDILVYQPTVLRYYNCQSNEVLRNIDVQFYYGTKDGSLFPVMLLPNEYASCKLQFQQPI